MTNFTAGQYKLILIALRRYQQIYNADKKIYTECQDLLDLLMKMVYNQGREQPN